MSPFGPSRAWSDPAVAVGRLDLLPGRDDPAADRPVRGGGQEPFAAAGQVQRSDGVAVRPQRGELLAGLEVPAADRPGGGAREELLPTL